jgi:hypothetical protein
MRPLLFSVVCYVAHYTDHWCSIRLFVELVARRACVPCCHNTVLVQKNKHISTLMAHDIRQLLESDSDGDSAPVEMRMPEARAQATRLACATGGAPVVSSEATAPARQTCMTPTENYRDDDDDDFELELGTRNQRPPILEDSSSDDDLPQDVPDNPRSKSMHMSSTANQYLRQEEDAYAQV